MSVEVKFGDWIQKGFDAYKANMGALIVAGLVAWLLTMITGGILAGPMFAGLALMALDIVDGKAKPEMGRLFNGFSFFGQSFLFMVVWGLLFFVVAFLLNLIICIGTVAAMFVGFSLGTLLMFALFLIVDRKQAFWPASMESLNAVKAQFWPLLGFYAVATLIGGVGSIACGIGAGATLPINVCMVAVAYRQFFPAQGAPAPQA